MLITVHFQTLSETKSQISIWFRMRCVCVLVCVRVRLWGWPALSLPHPLAVCVCNIRHGESLCTTCLLHVGGQLMENNKNERTVLSGQLRGKLPQIHIEMLPALPELEYPNNPSSIPGRRLFSSPQRPERFWDPPSLLSSAYMGALSAELKPSGWGVKLITLTSTQRGG
jgi:hypothetical protein